MRSKLFVFLVAAGLLLVLAACQPAAGAGATQNFTVIMGEGEVIGEVDGEEMLTGEYHRWEPNVLVVHKGDDVTLNVMNPRKNIHSFFLPGYNLDSGPLEPRSGEVTLEFTADQAGVFQWICNIPNDAAEGECDADHETMIGYLIVLEN
jgi:heme/copper-type cytochrome/quinol oxidase subunit 2